MQWSFLGKLQSWPFLGTVVVAFSSDSYIFCSTQTPGRWHWVPFPCSALLGVLLTVSLLFFHRSPSSTATSTSRRSDSTSSSSPTSLSCSLKQSRKKELLQQHSGDQKWIPQLPPVPLGDFHLPLACPVVYVCIYIHRYKHIIHSICPPLRLLVTWQYSALLWESFRSKTPVVPPCCWWEVLYALVCLPFRVCSILVSFILVFWTLGSPGEGKKDPSLHSGGISWALGCSMCPLHLWSNVLSSPGRAKHQGWMPNQCFEQRRKIRACCSTEGAGMLLCSL